MGHLTLAMTQPERRVKNVRNQRCGLGSIALFVVLLGVALPKMSLVSMQTSRVDAGKVFLL